MRFLWSFLVLTLRQPGVAARNILLRQWPSEAVWTGLFLAITLNTFSYTLLNYWYPLVDELSFLNFSTGTYLGISALMSLGFAATLSIGGRFLGGTGRFMPMLTLLVWLQLVQMVVQTMLIAVTVLSPALGSLLSLIANVFLFFVLLNFVNEAHGFASLWRALAVVVMATILVFFAMIFVVGLIGPDTIGLPENV
ncbi:Yip1 domain protein [Phaeobacter sp. CECT 5382]|uniref:Yip1 family protein n=1 Tax=Rhodobacterales TaxID=204455 RepID=UPI0006DBCC4E|nr:Yip1 family protein [Phaeobacter sp. CECT 5382]CUH88329.1 Yip1 domain protein [Phaeobacter sp. CECT 5382]